MLMDAALTMLDERGDVTFSMRELAARVGYAVTAVYRCYETRGHLLRQLTVKLFDLLTDRLNEATLEGDAREKAHQFGANFLDWSLEFPGRYRLMYLYTAAEAKLTPEERVSAGGPQRLLERNLRTGLERGELSSLDAYAISHILFASLHGLASLAGSSRLDPGVASDIVGFYERHVEVWVDPFLGPVPKF